MSQTRSAYPPDVADLMPSALSLAADLGRVPGRNEVMRGLNVGAKKANAVLAELVGETVDGAELREPDPDPAKDSNEASDGEVGVTADPGPAPRRRRQPWWLIGLVAPAFVVIWSGWVGLGGMTGFGPVNLLPGIGDGFTINTAITLPIGMETYAAYALRVWLTPALPTRARTFAMWSAFGALALGCSGQVAYHLMTAAHMNHAPWQITTLVACLPVGVLGMGAALAHLLRNGDTS